MKIYRVLDNNFGRVTALTTKHTALDWIRNQKEPSFYNVAEYDVDDPDVYYIVERGKALPNY